MKPRLVSCLAATTLFLAACSSGGATPLASTSKAWESPEPSATSQPGQPSNEAFCAALEDWANAFTVIGTDLTTLGNALSAAEDVSQLPSPEVLHETSLSMLAASDDANGFLEAVIANTADPAVAATLKEMNSEVTDFTVWIGTIGRDASDAMEFSTAIMAEYDRFDAFFAYMDTADIDGLDAYTSETCGDNFMMDSSPQAFDTSAKADVATLGMEIATYYLDNDEPDPTITILDGRYYLLDTAVGDVSAGNRITDQYYNGYADWCVEVTNDLGSIQTFTYSAQNGLNAGTCR